MPRKKIIRDEFGRRVNILVPFPPKMAEEVKRIAKSNGMPATVVIRMILDHGLDALKNGKKLELNVPGDVFRGADV